MALIKCPECEREISGKAQSCPHCGYPFLSPQNDEEVKIAARLSSRPSPALSVFCEITRSSFSYYKSGVITSKSYARPSAEAMISDLSEHGIDAELVSVSSVPVEPQTDVLRCPYCGSSQIQAVKKGFGLGKAAAGALLLGPVGLLGGALGSNKVQRVCLSCGKKF